MKTITGLQTAAIIVVLTIFGGCSNQISSSGEKGNSLSKENPIAGQQLSASEFHAQIKLNPHQIYTFDHGNTGLYKFNEISILNCDDTEKVVEVTAYFDDEAILLLCDSKGFEAKILMIQNLSSQIINLDIVLTGSKTKIKNKQEF